MSETLGAPRPTNCGTVPTPHQAPDQTNPCNQHQHENADDARILLRHHERRAAHGESRCRRGAYPIKKMT